MPRWFFLLSLALPASLNAAEPDSVASALQPENVKPPGHSMHGETFDEGPRRAATLIGTTGQVSFPITTNSAAAQQFFNQGIGQLHGFWYFEAERSFRQASKLDPDSAMPYFGMTLANVNNEKRAKGFIGEAVKRKSISSEREKMYIDAWDAWYRADAGDRKKEKDRAKNQINALENIVFQNPDDLEAKAILCLSHWEHRSALDEVGHFTLDALLNNILAVNPYHPVHHYRVHLWDNDKAKMAVNSAERCGLSAPGIAHMWHMSGHTYSDLHQYFDAAWHQEAAARTDHAYMMREKIFPDRIHNFAHNNEWLGRNMQHLGRVHDAVILARNSIELPQHPKLNRLTGNNSAHYGRMRLFQIYSDFEMWDQLITDAQSQILGPTSDESEQVKYYRTLGRAYFRNGDSEKGRIQLTVLENRLSHLQHEIDAAIEAAVAKATTDGVDAKEVEARKKQATNPTNEKKKTLERAISELNGYVKLAEGTPAEALEQFASAEGLDESFLANIEFLADKKEQSLKRLRDWVNGSKNQVRPLASLIEMLWKQEKPDEAKQLFGSLREISGAIDLDLPPFERLRPIANAMGFATDWRLPKPVARNAAELPALSSLGPLTWQPTVAPGWSLPDGSGSMQSLDQYRGRPVIVIFYLGYGCLHCAEQLQAFAPKQHEYSDAGISLIAISTDTVQNLNKAREKYKSDGTFPFQIVSDSSLDVFKTYHAHDDFEDSPLHATFLIDGEGKIRWHDIGAEPFMEVDFLLNESKRLLYPAKIEIPST